MALASGGSSIHSRRSCRRGSGSGGGLSGPFLLLFLHCYKPWAIRRHHHTLLPENNSFPLSLSLWTPLYIQFFPPLSSLFIKGFLPYPYYLLLRISRLAC